MNGTGFFLAALLLVVLLAVVLSAQQTQDMRAEEFRQLMQQRDEAVRLAQEAKTQRDQMAYELSLAQMRLADMRAGSENKEAEIRALADERDEAVRLASERQARAAVFAQKNAELEQEVDLMRAQIAAPIPVSGGQLNGPVPTTRPGISKHYLPAQAEGAHLPVELDLMTGLGAVVCLAALGGGGYAAFHLNAGLKH